MANFNKDSTDLPSEDKDGNPITQDNPLSLEDILVRMIETTDPVLGLRPGQVLTAPTDSPYNWALLGLFLRDIYLEEKIENVEIPDTVRQATTRLQGILRLATVAEAEGLSEQFAVITPHLLGEALKHVNAEATPTKRGTAEIADQTEGNSGTDNKRIMTSLRVKAFLRSTLAKATTRLQGTAKIANQTEGRTGTDNSHIMTSLRVLDFLRHGSGSGASTTHKGTVERATQAEAEGLNNTTRYLTAALVKAILEHQNAQATTNKRGTVEIATPTEALDENNDTHALTPASLYRTAAAGNFVQYRDTFTPTPTEIKDGGEGQFFGPIKISGGEGGVIRWSGGGQRATLRGPQGATVTVSGSLRVVTNSPDFNFREWKVSTGSVRYVNQRTGSGEHGYYTDDRGEERNYSKHIYVSAISNTSYNVASNGKSITAHYSTTFERTRSSLDDSSDNVSIGVRSYMTIWIRS